VSAAALLAEWAARIQWDHTGAFGKTESVVCPVCRAKGRPGVPSWQTHEEAFKGAYVSRPDTITHTPACLIGRTLALLGDAAGDRMTALEAVAELAGEVGLTPDALAHIVVDSLSGDQLIAVAERLRALRPVRS